MSEPKPAVVTWCEACRRIGMRRQAEPLDEVCRYCRAGDVRRKTLPSRTAARAFMARYRQAHPIETPAA